MDMAAIIIGETKLSEVCHALFTTTHNPFGRPYWNVFS